MCGYTGRWVVDWLFVIDDYGQYLYSTGIIIHSWWQSQEEKNLGEGSEHSIIEIISSDSFHNY